MLDDEVVTVEVKPRRRSLWQAVRSDCHWKCLALSVAVASCLFTVAWCRVSVARTTVKQCSGGYLYAPITLALLLYFAYLIECWSSHSRMQVWRKAPVSRVYQLLERMRGALPLLWWKVSAYHYVRRQRQPARPYVLSGGVTGRGGGGVGGRTGGGRPLYQRVNSRTVSGAFNFAACGCLDTSYGLWGLECYPATKVAFSRGCTFLCPEAEALFNSQRSAFYRNHEGLDDYAETREGFDLLHVRCPDYVIALSRPHGRQPWYLNPWVNMAATFLLLSWPIRILIQCRLAHVHCHVQKAFGHLLLRGDWDVADSGGGGAGGGGGGGGGDVMDCRCSGSPQRHPPPNYREALRMPRPERDDLDVRFDDEEDDDGNGFDGASVPSWQRSQSLLTPLPTPPSPPSPPTYREALRLLFHRVSTSLMRRSHAGSGGDGGGGERGRALSFQSMAGAGTTTCTSGRRPRIPAAACGLWRLPRSASDYAVAGGNSAGRPLLLSNRCVIANPGATSDAAWAADV